MYFTGIHCVWNLSSSWASDVRSLPLLVGIWFLMCVLHMYLLYKNPWTINSLTWSYLGCVSLTIAWAPPWSYDCCFSDTGVPCGEGTWKIVSGREEKYTNVWRQGAKRNTGYNQSSVWTCKVNAPWVVLIWFNSIEMILTFRRSSCLSDSESVEHAWRMEKLKWWC